MNAPTFRLWTRAYLPLLRRYGPWVGTPEYRDEERAWDDGEMLVECFPAEVSECVVLVAGERPDQSRQAREGRA